MMWRFVLLSILATTIGDPIKDEAAATPARLMRTETPSSFVEAHITAHKAQAASSIVDAGASFVSGEVDDQWRSDDKKDEGVPFSTAKEPGCNSTNVTVTLPIYTSFLKLGCNASTIPGVEVQPYNNVYCHRRRTISSNDPSDADCLYNSSLNLPCTNPLSATFPPPTYPSVPAECGLDSNRRRTIDADMWSLKTDANGTLLTGCPTWEDVECSHRRRDNRRRQPPGVTPDTIIGVKRNGNGLDLINTSSPHVFTVGLYQEANGRIYTVGEAIFNNRHWTPDNAIIMRHCPGCAAAYQTIYYRRLTNLSHFNLFSVVACGWNTTTFPNVHGTDFALFSSLQEALNNNNRWAVCPTTGLLPLQGFPGNCYPDDTVPLVAGQWNSVLAPGTSCASTKVPVAQAAVNVPNMPGVFTNQPQTEVFFYILENSASVLLRKPQEPTSNGMVAWFKSENADTVWVSSVNTAGFFVAVPPPSPTGTVQYTNVPGPKWDNRGNGRPGTSSTGGHASFTSFVRYLQGTAAQGYDFGMILSRQATVCSISRYAGNRTGRVLSGGDNNWFHGHWRGMAGFAYHDTWKTSSMSPGQSASTWIRPQANIQPQTWTAANNPSQKGSQNWAVLCAAGAAGQPTHSQGVSINYGGCCGVQEASDWAVMEVMAWNRILTDAEMFAAVQYLQWKLDNGTPQTSDGPSIGNLHGPALPTSGLNAWFQSSCLDPAGRGEWVSSINGFIGKGTNVNVVSNALPIGDPALSISAMSGSISSSYDFGPVLGPLYTVCSATRYTGVQNQGKILTSTNGDVFGHWQRRAGVARYNEVWRTDNRHRNQGSTRWMLMCGSNGGGSVLEGVMDVSINNKRTVPVYPNITQNWKPDDWKNQTMLDYYNYSLDAWYETVDQHLIINKPNATSWDVSDWMVMEVAVWNRQLSSVEMTNVIKKFQFNLATGTAFSDGQCMHGQFNLVQDNDGEF